MSAVLDKPQTLFLRRALFQIHLWTGLAIGLWALGIGITGSVLVFHRQIDDAGLRAAAPAFSGTGQASAQAMLESVRKRFDKGIVVFRGPREAGGAVVANVYTQSQGYQVLVNPHTAELLLVRGRQGTWLQWMERFHSNLFLGRPGRVANGVGGLLLFLMVVTGLIIWWPGRTLWTRRLKVNFRAPWRVWNFDLHNAVGFWCLFYIALSEITGAYFTWPQVYRGAISGLWPMSQRPPLRVEAQGERRQLDELLAAAEGAVPGLPVVRYEIPPDARQPVRVVKLEREPESQRNNVTVFVNPYTAAVMRVDRVSDGTLGDRLFSWIGPLHTGHFGPGIVALLWAVLGLSLPLLFLSGFLMWWNRVIARRL